MTPSASKRAAASRRPLPRSHLEAFCFRHRITTPLLAASANVSRQHIARLAAGKVPYVTLDMAKQLAKGASRILRRKVAVAEMFDLDYFCSWD